jgi:hypothetical protein
MVSVLELSPLEIHKLSTSASREQANPWKVDHIIIRTFETAGAGWIFGQHVQGGWAGW